MKCNSFERASSVLLEPIFERAERYEAEAATPDDAELGKNLSEEEGARDAEGLRRLLGPKRELRNGPRVFGCLVSYRPHRSRPSALPSVGGRASCRSRWGGFQKRARNDRLTASLE